MYGQKRRKVPSYAFMSTDNFDSRLKSAVEAIYREPAELFKEKLIFKMLLRLLVQ